MNVIFCDIDGTINPLTYRGNDMFMEGKLEVLSEICNKTNSSIVISSSWKLCTENEELAKKIKKIFFKYNINFLGFTPSVPNPNRANGQRMWKEWDIEYYLYLHPEIDKFCILDDEDYDLNNYKDKLVFIDYKTGITGYYTDEIIKKLNK